MGDIIPLSLHAMPKLDPNKESLPFLISRINHQRGSFRNITEESLREEIRAAEDVEVDGLEGAIDGTDAQDIKSRQEELIEARQEMLSQVQQALFQSSGALSLVSFVLAGDSPQAATSQQALGTIDPYIRERFSRDAFSVDKMQVPPRPEESQSKDVFELGWKTQSLEGVADSLLNSATRLEKELESETRYWNQVLQIKDQGWPVARLPKERHALGVRYGSAEAYADFRDRGLAALRRDEDGDVTVDRGSSFHRDRKLRVQVLRHGRVVQCSRLSASNLSDPDEAMEDDSVEDQIRQARNSLFDEELYAELHREARNLTNQGVTCLGDLIQLPYEADKVLQIDLVESEDPELEGLQDEGTVPTAMCIVLRMLLSHTHRQNLYRRSQPPPPLTDSKAPRPIYQILKPIMEHMRHRTNLQSCYTFITYLTKTLAAGGIVLEMQQDTTALFSIPMLETMPEGAESATELLICSLVAPPSSSFTLQLPSRLSLVRVDVLTDLFPPNFGTRYTSTMEVSKPENFTAMLPNIMHFNSVHDLETHLKHVVTVDLIDHITTTVGGYTVMDPHTGMLSKTFSKHNGVLGSLSLRILVESNKLALEMVSQSGDDGIAHGGEPFSKQSFVWFEGASIQRNLLDIINDSPVDPL